MKWKAPRQGDRRVNKYFAYLPVSADGFKVWLVWYWIEEVYEEGPYGGWTVTKRSLTEITL